MKTLKTNQSQIDLDRFGQYMGQLDLRNVPPHKHKAAVKDHLLRIQEATLEDRDIAAKINISRRILASRTSSK